MGKNIDQVKAQLGSPYDDDETPTPGDTDDTESKTWLAPGSKKMLNVEFHRTTRQVIKFSVDFDGNDIQNMPADPEEFVKAGNLKDNDLRYTIVKRESRTPEGEPRGVYAGIDITPN